MADKLKGKFQLQKERLKKNDCFCYISTTTSTWCENCISKHIVYLLFKYILTFSVYNVFCFLLSCSFSLISSDMGLRLKFAACCKRDGNFILLAFCFVYGSTIEHSHVSSILPAFYIKFVIEISQTSAVSWVGVQSRLFK